MFSITILLLGMFFTVRGTRAQSVTQPDDHIAVSEGDPLELRCNYSYGGTLYLFWYVQYPSQGLQLLLKYLSGATLVKGIKAHLSDSAEYFCALSDTEELNTNLLRHEFSDTRGHSLICFQQGLSCDESEQGGDESPGECLAPEDK
ncbi:hypothetical protein HPG69_002114 [Diceros bicornis minor]|uniref:Ig-like domain-containing protein n=1 Tax=Diceros bicornis minor TaxID=77932 RepID=A0A7J7FC83_DICBM|nr:hypothetical protein HPG69_002114 [Diceros bicornis minor]